MGCVCVLYIILVAYPKEVNGVKRTEPSRTAYHVCYFLLPIEKKVSELCEENRTE